MKKIKVRSNLSSEIYQQLQQYMTMQGLSEATAIEVIVNSYFLDRPQDELIGRIAKIEQALSDLKRHMLAIRFR
ncbi:MAG: hypothetical protein LDL41_17405 [Coleofasciculus sp. S288]|nr:hypothetical protein [Coleofasciculus sp. S288]